MRTESELFKIFSDNCNSGRRPANTDTDTDAHTHACR